MTDADATRRERAALDLLERALELPAAERERFLATACAEDAELHLRVAALLPLQSDLGPAPWAGWIQRDGFGMASDCEPGAQIAAYEILRPIATGGMGRVYLARQQNPDRDVALKVLRLEFESDETRQRFRYEAEVLARLRHPGIATIYEAGIHREQTTSGAREVPWIALEYVPEARPIDEFARAEGLDQGARVRLVLQVLDAVHHGHQRGVIHRDLKPANILVDAAGHAKLIDFGVACRTGADRPDAVTVRGELVGTLYYMSPEQAAGAIEDVDVCSDVYALGVVLYELVCGRHPHDLEGLSLPAAARVVCEQLPLRPRLARPGLAPDLEAVLLQALAGDRSRRYQSAAAFAADLRAFLAGRAVSARSPGALGHLRLLARRNPAVVVAIGVALTALVAATIVSIGFALHERAARRAAERLQAAMLDQTFALHLDFAPKLADLEGSLDVRRAMIQEAVEKLELLDELAPDDDEVRLRLAAAYRSLGDVLGNPLNDNLGDLAGAEACYRRSLAMVEHAGAAVDTTFQATASRVRLAQLAFHAGRPDDALPHLEQFVALAARGDDLRHVPAELRSEVAAVLINLGSANGIRREFDRALASFRAAYDLRADLLAEAPSDPDRQIAAAVALSKVATARWSRREPDALADLRSAWQIVAAVVEREPAIPRYRRTLIETGSILTEVLLQRHDFDAAQDVLAVALRTNAGLRDAEPANAFYRRQHGNLAYYQAWLLRDRGRDERERGVADWTATLTASIEWLEQSRDVWVEMADRGELQPRERGHVDRIVREIAELRREVSE
ncbi:MAG: serine/threonine protein kinase [Planctomycetes bacterium]|nr:serine/threonine protein kinase [Planctomycetota bacterium]